METQLKLAEAKLDTLGNKDPELDYVDEDCWILETEVQNIDNIINLISRLEKGKITNREY